MSELKNLFKGTMGFAGIAVLVLFGLRFLAGEMNAGAEGFREGFYACIGMVREALQRRLSGVQMLVSELRRGELLLNLSSHELWKNDRQITLTPMEYKLLSLMMKNPGRIFTKAQLYENINGEFFESDENTIMVHISKLRDKIETDPKQPVYIKTVRGVGYRFEV